MRGLSSQTRQTVTSGGRHTARMAESRTRSYLASVVGWVFVIVLAVVMFRFVLGTLFWLVRTVLIVAVLAALLTLYLKLKSSD